MKHASSIVSFGSLLEVNGRVGGKSIAMSGGDGEKDTPELRFVLLWLSSSVRIGVGIGIRAGHRFVLFSCGEAGQLTAHLCSRFSDCDGMLGALRGTDGHHLAGYRRAMFFDG
jgi:hypothetical protein